MRQLLLLRARGMHEEVPQSVLHVPFLGGRDELAFYRERRGNEMEWITEPSAGAEPMCSNCFFYAHGSCSTKCSSQECTIRF